MSHGLHEIASYTGLSESTVSRVLNGRDGVSQASRDAVLTAVDVLGYERPNKLRTQDERIVGIVMPQFQNPVFPAFATAIGGHLAQRGLVPLTGVVESGGPSEVEYSRTLINRQAAGIVFVSGLHAVNGLDHSHYREITKRGMPVVAINGLADDLALPVVSTDDDESIQLAVKHVVQLGHSQLGLAIGDQEHVPGARKLAAFQRLVAASPALRGHVDQSLYSLEGGTASATHLIDKGVTAIICGSDEMAIGAIKAVHKRGLQVPQDISVVGYDDSPFMALIDPPITTIRQPVESLARAAAGLLFAQMSGRDARPGEIQFEPELVVRASTGPAPTRASR